MTECVECKQDCEDMNLKDPDPLCCRCKKEESQYWCTDCLNRAIDENNPPEIIKEDY